MALINKLTAIGDAIRTKTETTELLTLAEMPEAILGIGDGNGIPGGVFSPTGNCDYLFASDGNWDWFVESHGDSIKTNNVESARYMFYGSDLKQISMEFDFAGAVDCDYMFHFCRWLETPPYLSGQISSMNYMFDNCMRMKQIPEDWANTLSWNYIHTSDVTFNGVFRNCFSLRKIPESLLKNLYSKTEQLFSYRECFYGCKSMDEIKGLAVINREKRAGGTMFSNSFDLCYRLKDMTFETQEDGTPIKALWTYQTIDLSKNVGYQPSTDTANTITSFSAYNGITADKRVTDDESYQRLKNDPDWWTTDLAYSRYNKASALRTINSLPDASDGEGNVIKFSKYAGSATDDKACGGLAVAEIAIASSKGWTVTFVV